MARLSAPIRNYGDVLTVIFHHRDTEDTETLFLFTHPARRDDGQKKAIHWMKMPNLCKVARTIADKADAFRLPPSPGKRKNIHLSALCASVVRSNCR